MPGPYEISHLDNNAVTCGESGEEFSIEHVGDDARTTGFFTYTNTGPVAVTATFTVACTAAEAVAGVQDPGVVQLEFGTAAPPSTLFGESVALDVGESDSFSSLVAPGGTFSIAVKPFFVNDSDLGTVADVNVAGTVSLSCVAEDSCGIQIDPAARTVDDEGDTGLSVSVDVAAEDCEWTATVTSGGAWLSIASGASGTGDGTTTYDVAEYDGEEDRVGTILFETADDSATHTVTQTPCESVTKAFAFVQGQVPSRSRRQDGYRHTQGSPATVWTIEHNLGKRPTVTAQDGSGNTLIGEVAYTDLDTVTITFGTARSGSAQLT